VQDPPAPFIIHSASKSVPEIAFADDRERRVSVKEFRGKFVVFTLCVRALQQGNSRAGLVPGPAR
jgi:hypothetical protein